MENKTETFHDWPGLVAILVLRMPVEKIGDSVRTWVNEVWMPENKVWNLSIQTGIERKHIRNEDRNFEDSFDGIPFVTTNGSEVQISFGVNNTKSFWRDWIILKFRGDLMKAFPNTELVDLKVEKRE